MKQILSLLFVLLICLTPIAGCGSSNDKTDNASSVPVNGGMFSTADVSYLDSDNESVYRIIRPVDDKTVSKMAVELVKTFKVQGITVKNQDDSSEDADAYEILLGETNRTETQQAKDYLIATAGGRVNDYIICTIGKKIVIYGMNYDALNTAIDYFTQNFLKKDGVKGGIKQIHATNGNFVNTTINGVSIGKFKFVKQRYNESYLVHNQMDETNKLLVEKAGYRLDIVEDHKEAVEYEIIVGNASREGVVGIDDKDEYSIKISGKKVYLNGGSPSAKAMAVSEFAKMLSAGSVTDADSVTASYNEKIASYDTSAYYTSTWSEDFDAVVGTHETGIDLTKWAWGYDSAEGHNNRTSVRSQSAEHLYVADGMLNFYATYDKNNYYGFKITTSGKMRFRYGILEMSAILPHGDAFWISLWANSTNAIDEESPSAFFSEVNVVEMFGNSASEASNLHGWLKNGQRDLFDALWGPAGLGTHWSLDGEYAQNKKYTCPEGKFNDGLHTFTYIWDENSSKFACDGNVYFNLDHNAKSHYNDTFTQPIYLILSQATAFATGSGKNMADDAPEWTESNNFQIDYVHIYQKNDGLHTITIY